MAFEIGLWVGLGAIVVLMALSAFFSSSEIALFSLKRHKIDALAEEGDRKAALVKELRDDPTRLLVTILVGNNVVNIAISSVATALFVLYLPPGQAVLATTVVISLLILIFSESAPKAYAVGNAEAWSMRVVRWIRLSEYVMYPVVSLVNGVTGAINRLTGGARELETPYLTRGDIEQILRSSEEDGVIEDDERRMMMGAFRLSNTIAKEVMTPRLDMVSVPDDAALEKVLDTLVENDVTLAPVYHEVMDQIRGVVDIRDVSRGVRRGLEVEDVVRPTLHVPETREIDDLLREMQEERIHMAIVIDEFGSTEGLVTVEDIVEEIVGEIFDVGEEPPIKQVDRDTFIVKGEVNIHEVNERVGIELPEEGEFETIAGFIYRHTGRLVEEGERVEHPDAVLTVEEANATRILKVRIEKFESEGDEE